MSLSLITYINNSARIVFGLHSAYEDKPVVQVQHSNGLGSWVDLSRVNTAIPVDTQYRRLPRFSARRVVRTGRYTATECVSLQSASWGSDWSN